MTDVYIVMGVLRIDERDLSVIVCAYADETLAREHVAKASARGVKCWYEPVTMAAAAAARQGGKQ